MRLSRSYIMRKYKNLKFFKNENVYNMSQVNTVAVEAIKLLQQYIDYLGFTPLIHFELEGCFEENPHSNNKINYALLNKQLLELNIDGQLVPEYWSNQWEYVSLFNGQSPLKEADNLTQAIHKIPELLLKQGIKNTLIKPVVWCGDRGKLAIGCENIFTNESRSVHIPNAIQMNVSALDHNGNNIIPKSHFGEHLQQCFLQTSLSCCLLYLPEEEAFERLLLKDTFGLAEELCSPTDISGGHQGSIALYKKIGKHNQKMGGEPLIYDQFNNILLSEYDWEKTARIEHRLGASSLYYNAYVNVVFGLLNVVQAIEKHNNNCDLPHKNVNDSKALPLSLHDDGLKKGAITLFIEDLWFNETLNQVENKVTQIFPETYKTKTMIGDKLKRMIINQYKPSIITSSLYSY